MSIHMGTLLPRDFNDVKAAAERVSLMDIERVLMFVRAASPAEPRGAGTVDDVRALLWEAQPSCCGNTCDGASYMGSTEEVCCGKPDMDSLSDAEIVRRLRLMFPEPAAESVQEVANG